jgi:hypothetical protein
MCLFHFKPILDRHFVNESKILLLTLLTFQLSKQYGNEPTAPLQEEVYNVASTSTAEHAFASLPSIDSTVTTDPTINRQSDPASNPPSSPKSAPMFHSTMRVSVQPLARSEDSSDDEHRALEIADDGVSHDQAVDGGVRQAVPVVRRCFPTSNASNLSHMHSCITPLLWLTPGIAANVRCQE